MDSYVTLTFSMRQCVHLSFHYLMITSHEKINAGWLWLLLILNAMELFISVWSNWIASSTFFVLFYGNDSKLNVFAYLISDAIREKQASFWSLSGDKEKNKFKCIPYRNTLRK